MEPFCRVPRVFWCFDFFSEYLQKSLYISIFLYPKGEPLKPHSIYGIRERAHNMERGFRGSPLEYGNMEIWSRFCRVPRFFGVLIFFRIPPKVTLYLYIPIFQG